MQRPATCARPATTPNTTAIATRDLVTQRQPAVHAIMPAAVRPSAQQSTVIRVSMAGSVEADQPLHEPLEQHRSKELRKEVSRLKLKVNRSGGPEGNDHKHGYIALIREFHRGSAMLSECCSVVETMVADPARDNSSRDPTIKMLSALFSDQLWRKFYSLHHTIAQRNRSMLSHTVATLSIDMYSPMQSAESLRFWEELANVLRGSFNAGGDAFMRCTPLNLFNTWRKLCAACNDKVQERIEDPVLANQLAYLHQLLKRRPALASLVTIGNFYSTFEPIVPVEAPQVPHQVPLEVRQSLQPVRIPDEDDDDLAFITDDDDNGISQDIATQPSAVSSSTSEKSPRQLEASAASVDPQITTLQREFWHSKKELVTQNIANAKLQFSILQAKYAEEQLCGSKRKIQVLQEELHIVDQNSYAVKKIHDELVREKRRMLNFLLRTGQP